MGGHAGTAEEGGDGWRNSCFSWLMCLISGYSRAIGAQACHLIIMMKLDRKLCHELTLLAIET